MGGEREDIIAAPKREQTSNPVEIEGDNGGILNIRIHESKGEVHFHADKEGLKVAVPAADWWKAWERLKTLNRMEEEFNYVDKKNKAILFVTTSLDEDDDGGKWSLNASISIIPFGTTNTVYDQLQKFTGAK